MKLENKINLCDYDVMMNGEDELMLVFEKTEGTASDPFLTVDTSEAILVKSLKTPQIAISNIPTILKNTLYRDKQLLICELDKDGEPWQIYEAPILRKV